MGLERAGMQTSAFCEIEPFCQQVLRKHWPAVPIYNDIRKLNAEKLRKDGIRKIDIVCGGFPCQPFSAAGRKRGTQDHRDLWPEMCRIIEETKPTWVIGENVANFTDMAFTRTKADLESRGYQVQPFIIPACAVGAPHKRDRVWIIAHTDSAGLQTEREKQRSTGFKQFGLMDRKAIEQERQRISNEWLGTEPGLCRGDYGVSERMDRIKSSGNTIVPLIAEIFGRGILSLREH